MAAEHRIQIALQTEDLPAEDMPSPASSPGASAAVGNTATRNVGPAPSRGSSAAPLVELSPAANAPLLGDSNTAAQAETTPTAMPTDVAPLEVGSIQPQMQISDAPLQPYIAKARAQSPALAASLGMTDQARDQILHQHEGDAIQTLTRAISIDSSNPYAYFYLGRAYLDRKNYVQALTFFKRAETGFGANPEWLGETLSFQGLANEQSGDINSAIGCYQKTLVAVPGNLMARVGLNRLGGADQAAPVAQPVSDFGAPGGSIGAPPPGGALLPPPSEPPPQPID